MAKIVDLHTYRSRQRNERVFGPWRTAGYYELIMGALDLGLAAGFYTLDKGDQLKVVEVHLFLADQIRFELMRRLNWITGFACQAYTLLELIRNTDKLKRLSRDIPLELSTAHTAYDAFQELTTRDKEAFVRRLLPEAIDSFRTVLE